LSHLGVWLLGDRLVLVFPKCALRTPEKDAAELELLPPVQNRATNGWKRAVPWRRILRDRNLRHLSNVYFCWGFVICPYLARSDLLEKKLATSGNLRPSGKPSAVCRHGH
jgi:hypothetical protein